MVVDVEDNMSTKEQLENDIKDALRSRNETALSTLRMLRAAIMNKAIELKKKDEGLSEKEIIVVIKSEVKKLKDAIVDFTKGNREDLAEQNRKEVDVLKKYLPPEMSEDETRIIVKKIIGEMDASPSDIGKVMGKVMGELQGKADGSLVRKLVQEELSA